MLQLVNNLVAIWKSYIGTTTTEDPRWDIFGAFEELMATLNDIEEEIDNWSGSQSEIPKFQNITVILESWINGNITNFWNQSYEVSQQNLSVLEAFLQQLRELWEDFKNGLLGTSKIMFKSLITTHKSIQWMV